MLSDGDHIRNMLGMYCERIDGADYAGVGELFGPDGALVTADGIELARGSEAIAAFYAGLVKLHDGEQRTKHLVTNTVLHEEGGTITARSAYLVLQATDDMPLQPIIAGSYTDLFERLGEELRWVERRFTADLTGHLSQHIRQV